MGEIHELFVFGPFFGLPGRLLMNCKELGFEEGIFCADCRGEFFSTCACRLIGLQQRIPKRWKGIVSQAQGQEKFRLLGSRSVHETSEGIA